MIRTICAVLLSFASLVHAQEMDESAQRLADYLGEKRVQVVDEPTQLQRAVVVLNALDSEGDVVDGTAGLVIEEGLVLTTINQLLEAEAISVRARCCDERAAEGVVAFDMRTGFAYLSVPGIKAEPYTGGFSEMPEVLPEALDGMYPLPFRIEGVEGVAKITSEVIRDWRCANLPRTVVIRNSYRNLGAGGLILDDDGRPFGMVGFGAGGGHMGVVPISPHAELVRLDKPIRGIDAIDHAPDDLARSVMLSQRAAVTRRSDPRSAAAIALEAIELDESNAEAHYQLGVCLDMMGQKDRAVASLRRSVELDPQSSESWYSLGLVLLTQEKYAEAIENFERAAANDPYYGDVHAMLGLAYVRDSRPNAGIKSLNVACDLEPSNFQFLYNLESTLNQYDRQHEIPAAWMRFIEDDPDDADRWQLALIQTMRAKQYDAFAAMARDAEQRLGEHDAILGGIGLRHLMDGDEETAEAFAQRALAIDPEDFLALSVQYTLEARREQEGSPPP